VVVVAIADVISVQSGFAGRFLESGLSVGVSLMGPRALLLDSKAAVVVRVGASDVLM